VEALQDHLGGLLRERESLQLEKAGRERLEANRLAIVAAQWDLAHALLARAFAS
jgi:hypothetical protein